MSQQESKGSEQRNKEGIGASGPMSFFDVDGTITNGYAILSFARYLKRRDVISSSSLENMENDFETHSESDRGHDAYLQFATDLVNHYAQALVGRSTDVVSAVAREFFKKVVLGPTEGYSICPYTRELIQMTRQFGKVVAITGSPFESLEPLQKHFKFDDLRATTIVHENGAYTGEVNLNLAIDVNKEAQVREFLEGGDVDTERSFAFGDSEHDLPLLEAVGNPFVLGNNPRLQEIGLERGWHVIKNPKNVTPAVRRQIYKVFKDRK